MKIKITEPGWGGYTGTFGSTEFHNGVSVHEVGQQEAQRLAAAIAIVTVSDDGEGKSPSAAQRIIDAHIMPLGDATPMASPVEAQGPEAKPMAAVVWTRAELEEIADKQGVRGLRQVAAPLGIKSNSIADLIDKVLAANPPATSEAQAVESAETPADEVSEPETDAKAE